MHQDATWYGGRPQPRRLCVRWGPSPTRKGAEHHPIFDPRLLWLNGCMDQDVAWYEGRRRPTRHCVRWGPSSPPLNWHSSQFSANVHCGQTAGWAKMPLGMEVGLVPWDSATPIKGDTHPHPIFGPCLLWPNGWMDQDATWYGGKRRLKRRCVRWGRSTPSPKLAQLPIIGQYALWPNSWMG